MAISSVPAYPGTVPNKGISVGRECEVQGAHAPVLADDRVVWREFALDESGPVIRL